MLTYGDLEVNKAYEIANKYSDDYPEGVLVIYLGIDSGNHLHEFKRMSPKKTTMHIYNSEIDYFIKEIHSTWAVCECGSDKLGFQRHSHWCPKYEEIT